MKTVSVTLLASMFLLGGCAYVETNPAPLGSAPKGVRVYGTKTYLAVDVAKGTSTVFSVQNRSEAYDVRPVSILAKHDFQIDVDDVGQLKALKSNQDPTSFLTFVKDVGSLAAKASGLPVGAQANISGTFGLESGLYVLGDNGLFTRVSPGK